MMRYFGGWWNLGDPGRCPVDDAPHTTCVAPSSTARSAPILVRVRRPFALERYLESYQPVINATTPQVETVTAADYKRPRGRRP